MDNTLLVNKIRQWKKEIGMEIEYETFLKSIKDIYVTTNIVKYRSFQYRLIMRAIVTNIHLKHWGMLESDSCYSCRKDRESYTHLFIHCEYVKALWLKFENWIECFTDDKICFGVDTVLVNRIIEQQNYLFKVLCLLLKQFVHKKGVCNKF